MTEPSKKKGKKEDNPGVALITYKGSNFPEKMSHTALLNYVQKTKGVFWRDTFEGSQEISLPRNAIFRVLTRHTQKAKKVLGYLVAKHFSGFLCVYQNNTLDNFFLSVLATTYFTVYRGRWPSLM